MIQDQRRLNFTTDMIVLHYPMTIRQSEKHKKWHHFFFHRKWYHLPRNIQKCNSNTRKMLHRLTTKQTVLNIGERPRKTRTLTLSRTEFSSVSNTVVRLSGYSSSLSRCLVADVPCSSADDGVFPPQKLFVAEREVLSWYYFSNTTFILFLSISSDNGRFYKDSELHFKV